MAATHQVAPLAAARLAELGRRSAVQAALQQEAVKAAAADLLRERELRRVLDALDRAGVSTLVIKGAQLAYSLYARPHLRARLDTDLFVAAASRAEADQVLTGCGYERPQQVTGDLVLHQAFYVRRHAGVAVHALDVHWKIANPHVFAGVLTFEEAWTDSIPLVRLAASARGLSPVHALFLACVHRVAHHYDSDSLMWLYDIHLIASELTDADWSRFLDLARERRVSAVCRTGLARAAARFATVVPRRVLDSLVPAADAAGPEASAAYLARHRRPVDNFLADVRALPGWTARLQLVREHLFPPRRYMHDVYAPDSRAPLALLYARRVVRGARRWLART
jgi:hypothetical protein